VLPAGITEEGRNGEAIPECHTTPADPLECHTYSLLLRAGKQGVGSWVNLVVCAMRAIHTDFRLVAAGAAAVLAEIFLRAYKKARAEETRVDKISINEVGETQWEHMQTAAGLRLSTCFLPVNEVFPTSATVTTPPGYQSFVWDDRLEPLQSDRWGSTKSEALLSTSHRWHGLLRLERSIE
jgi:hypothetical protein